MAKQKAKQLTPDLLAPKTPATHGPDIDKPVAMTLKLPHDLYVRLKQVAAIRKSKGQALMLEAVREYLDRIAS